MSNNIGTLHSEVPHVLVMRAYGFVKNSTTWLEILTGNEIETCVEDIIISHLGKRKEIQNKYATWIQMVCFVLVGSRSLVPIMLFLL
jgi:hypothetical protein